MIVELVAWDGSWAEDDPDANFKRDVALYGKVDPLAALVPLAEATGVPVGAIARYVLARWAAAGSESLLAAGPSVINRMAAVCESAIATDTPEARLEAFEVLQSMISWLRAPLID